MTPTETTTQIAHNWHFARDFPLLPPNLIERPHLLETIVEILSSDTAIVFLEGGEGDGATTTLAQFCHKYPEHSFSLFIKPASRFAYSLDYLRLALAEQFYWYLHGTSLNKDTLDESEFESLLLKTQRKERTKTLYFVVDGLHQIPADEAHVVGLILKEVLPIGMDRCRFIITGQQSALCPLLQSRIKSKPYQQLRFQPQESRIFLADTGIQDTDCSIVHSLCRGIPGRLAAVRRLLLSGTSLASILENDPTKYLEFVKLEFGLISAMEEHEQMTVAAIAFSKMGLSVDDISSLVGITVDAVQNTLSRCQFMVTTNAGQVMFISETHRKFACKQLERLKVASLEAQLQYLLKNPRSEISLRYLPTYYESLNQLDALVDLLSKEHYCDLLESTQSFAELRSRAEAGARSAANLHRTHDVFKFSLQRTIFASASTAESDSARIEALVALGKSNAALALALAKAEATKEDRLDLLCAYARRVKERYGEIDDELLSLIKNLITQVNFSDLGDKAVRLAANVLIFDPDIAIGIIESAVKGASAAARDAAFTELSLSASLSKLKHRTKIEDKARLCISDDSLQKVAHSFEVLAERLDSTELIGTVSKMPAGHQIFFLRSFINLRRHDAKVLDLVEYGLDTIIRETEYTPRAKDLAELCVPFLSKVEDTDRMRKLVARFDSQLGLVAKSAHSRDLTVLQMRLAAAEYQYDKQLARDRIEQAYYEVSDIRTPEVQLECLALMLRALRQMDKVGELEARDGFRAVVRDDLNKLLEVIIKNTGDHLAAVSPVLRVLAADDCIVAQKLAGRLNTESRRNSAYALVALVIVSQPFKEALLRALQTALGSITNLEIRSQATLALLGALDANSARAEWLPHIEALRPNLTNPGAHGKWDVWIMKASVAAGLAAPLDPFLERIQDATARIESPLEEAHLYFTVAEAIAQTDPERAMAHYEMGARVKSQTTFSTSTTLELFELCLSLVARSLTPLARANILDDDKLSRYVLQITQLPGVISKVRMFSEFAERLWCAKRKDLTDRIVQENLRPLLEQARLLGAHAHRGAMAIAFPAFTTSHLGLALPMVEELEPSDSDNVLHNAILLRLRKLPMTEPDMNGKYDHSKLEPSDVHDTLELMKKMGSDSALYWSMLSLVRAINDKLNRKKFTASQKADWSATLKEIIEQKLPDPRNITHTGFKVVALALAYSLVETHFAQWESLEAMAEAIDNVADRAFVFMSLAVSLPPKYNSHKKRYLEKTLELISHIPSPIDRLSHLQDYAEEAYASDAVASAKETLRLAMKLSTEIQDNAKTAQHRRELIDLADQIDPGLADELIEIVDDDPARVEMKQDAQKAGALVKAKRELANAMQIKDTLNCDVGMLPEAAWKNLAALEAGRLVPKPLDVMTEYVTLAGNSTLHDAYPVLSWHLENMARKFTSQRDIAVNISPVCEALLLSTELAHTIIDKAMHHNVEDLEEDRDEGLLVRRKTREEALRSIEEWVRANANEYIKYCDAYFSPKDISLLKLILGQAPQCKVYVLASKPYLINEGALSDDAFRKAWKEQCEQDPPETEVIALAYADSHRHVIHDRWLLTKGSGLRLGTSFNSLGDEKLSEISQIDAGRVAAIEEQLDRYIAKQRLIDGVKMQYTSFTLD